MSHWRVRQSPQSTEQCNSRTQIPPNTSAYSVSICKVRLKNSRLLYRLRERGTYARIHSSLAPASQRKRRTSTSSAFVSMKMPSSTGVMAREIVMLQAPPSVLPDQVDPGTDKRLHCNFWRGKDVLVTRLTFCLLSRARDCSASYWSP